MKQYKLLKDLPDIKAGAIFIEDSTSDWISHTQQKCVKSYPASVVIDSPEWFEPISQDTTEQESKFTLDEFYQCMDEAKKLYPDDEIVFINKLNSLLQRVSQLEKDNKEMSVALKRLMARLDR